MIINGINIDGFLNGVAAKLAHVSADVQAEFLNTFFEELRKCCETNYHAEFQLLSIRDRLHDGSKELVECLAAQK